MTRTCISNIVAAALVTARHSGRACERRLSFATRSEKIECHKKKVTMSHHEQIESRKSEKRATFINAPQPGCATHQFTAETCACNWLV